MTIQIGKNLFYYRQESDILDKYSGQFVNTFNTHDKEFFEKKQ